MYTFKLQTVLDHRQFVEDNLKRELAGIRHLYRFDADSLFARCREGLEGNFVPSYLQVVEEIPKTASEKPQERFLLEAFAPSADGVFCRE